MLLLLAMLFVFPKVTCKLLLSSLCGGTCCISTDQCWPGCECFPLCHHSGYAANVSYAVSVCPALLAVLLQVLLLCSAAGCYTCCPSVAHDAVSARHAASACHHDAAVFAAVLLPLLLNLSCCRACCCTSCLSTACYAISDRYSVSSRHAASAISARHAALLAPLVLHLLLYFPFSRCLQAT